MDAIEFDNVWKKFKRGEKFNSLRDMIPHLFKSAIKSKNGSDEALTDREFWATKNVSFHVKRGEVIGIIGPNGAGKSTILKMLSGIIVPTRGRAAINGKLSALIEVTAGFHPELTGRENVYLNGTILGMKKSEIDQQFDKIVEFSGIGDFIDTPVKRYSSGMFSRLGFSVAAHVNPEILLVDEVLAVGDISFQSRCAEKMRELLKSGVTIALVSHNLSLVQSLCQRIILLDHGEVLKDDVPDNVIPYYKNLISQHKETELKRKMKEGETSIVLDREPEVKIAEVVLQNDRHERKEIFDLGEEIHVQVQFESTAQLDNPVYSVDIIRADGVVCSVTNTRDGRIHSGMVQGSQVFTLAIKDGHLAPGIYSIRVAIIDKDLIHSFAIRNRDIFRIKEGKDCMNNSSAVYVPTVEWSLNGTKVG